MHGAQFYVALRNNEFPDTRYVDICPICGETSYTIQCQWCGVDIGVEEEKRSIEDAMRYFQDCEKWEVE